MKRMTLKEWQVLPASDKEVLRTLGLSSLLEPKLAKGRTKVPEPYVLHRITFCKLCESISEEYFRMLSSIANPSVLQAKSIAFKDVLPTDRIETVECSGSTCSHCYTVLSKESKMSLIRRIITLSKKRRLK